MNQSTGIHCKVICQDQMRRFQFSGTEFSSLQHQVNQLLGLNSEFVLKYKDNEGDMITLSSTEELSCAIEISKKKENGGLLRLTVFLMEPSSGNGPCPPCHVQVHTEHGRDFHHHHGYGKKWGHHGGRGFGCHEDGYNHFEKQGCRFGGPVSSENPHPWKGKRCHGGEFPCKNRFEKRKNKLMFKRDTLKACLSSLEEKKELSPEEERKKQMFLAKVQRIDSVLARFFSQTDPVEIPQKEETEFVNPKFRKCHRKFEKKEKNDKEHKDEMKKEKEEVNLSEEAKAEIITLKNQIKEMKPALWAIQDQLKSKKAEGRKAFANGQLPGSLKSEIFKLKKEKSAMKEKIVPLRQRIQHLKAGGK